MTLTHLNASAATLTKNRTEDSISPFSGMCTTCVDGCIGMCEIGKSAYRGAEMIYPQPFGIITTASQKDYPVDLSHFTILGRAAGAWGIEEDSNRALFPAVDLETTIGADNGIRYKLPFTVAAMGSTNVAKNNWPGLAVGAAITGTGIAIGENVVGMDMDSRFADGKVISSSDLEWRVQLFREWQTDGYGEVFVQANVQDRDLESFVREIRERIDREVVPTLPPGMTIEYSGEYEDLLRAGRTLRVILPATLLIIFLLLYVVYHSAKEAAHVILAVPFALTGGVFLQYLLGYNFSVAVWVGYIALFGTAIQTGVVMVVYLEEMLKKKQAQRGSAFNRDDLIQAIKDGARLRLRPKVMTVATIVASLLPIMWSTRTGAEVMKPLATPVIGGMLSSLIHILIVTPVIFAWLRERELRSTSK